jgi:hypothetical protein
LFGYLDRICVLFSAPLFNGGTTRFRAQSFTIVQKGMNRLTMRERGFLPVKPLSRLALEGGSPDILRELPLARPPPNSLRYPAPHPAKIIVNRFDRRMAFVPEGQADRSQHEVPARRSREAPSPYGVCQATEKRVSRFSSSTELPNGGTVEVIVSPTGMSSKLSSSRFRNARYSC